MIEFDLGLILDITLRGSKTRDTVRGTLVVRFETCYACQTRWARDSWMGELENK
jgi:hypothetical protein